MPIQTEPGEEAPFELVRPGRTGQTLGLGPFRWCVGMILYWSRHRLWWAPARDRQCIVEAMARFVEATSGVMAVCDTDRMGVLGSSQGSRFVLHPAAVGLAAHHGTKITACDGSAKGGDTGVGGLGLRSQDRPLRDIRHGARV